MSTLWTKRIALGVVAMALAVIVALVFGGRLAAPGEAVKVVTQSLTVAWRFQMTTHPNLPCAFEKGWIVTDSAGGVTALSDDGRRMWQANFSNQVFDCAASVVGGLAIVASQEGRVTGLRLATGERVWTREAGGRFQHAPLTGTCSGEPAVWLVSQEDGKLICLRASDGGVLWQSESTNRCDGEPVLWQGYVAYGNCDGAIYVFDAKNGSLRGSVVVGSDDQMAGGILATSDGRLVAGTRQGNLVAVNAAELKRESVIKISPNEAFVKPVEAFEGSVAMGTPEGDVVFWRMGNDLSGRVAVGAAVNGMLFDKGRLYVLAGGALSVFDNAGRAEVRLALGDEVSGPVAGHGGLLACVADQAVVCLKGGGK